jgi:DNA-binding MarR family transcriptional regulator
MVRMVTPSPNNLEEVAVESLRRITRALDVYSRTLLREHSLTGPQLTLLREVKRRGPAPIGTLAKASFLGGPTVTGIIDRLEAHGLVARVRGTEDRRQVLIQITPQGEQLLSRDPPLLSARFRAALAEMSEEEREEICRVLRRVATMMERAAQ